MTSVTMQKDLVAALKKETYLNVGILSKLHVMPPELSRQIFKENALEKPTQTLFNHLSHYLVCIIDHGASASLPWPLYDTKTERAYRNQLSSFITEYSNKGLLGPVMSSYLVNPGCYKVIRLIYQMSQLAVQKLLTTKMKDRQRKLYNEVTEKYNSQEKVGFLKQIEKKTELMRSTFSNYLLKRRVTEKIAELFRKKITEMESKLISSNAQNYLDELVNGFVANYTLDEATKSEILKIKNSKKPAPFFDNWLLQTDSQIDELESKWTEKVSPLISLSKTTQIQTELLISRCTGQADKNTYMIEYNHKTDFINTKELQNQVNSQQKYILKNIVKDEKLNFPNLIRGFLIAICFTLKNAEIGDEIYKFNEYLEGGRKNYRELVLAMRALMERVTKAEAKLQPSPLPFHSISVRDIPELPPLPDLSDLRFTRDRQCQALFDSFTPLAMSKHQFNLRRRTNFSFVRPQSKSLIVSSLTQGPKDDFLKSLISCRVSSYDRPNLDVTNNFHNMSVVSLNQRANETIAECSSGFTKQQIMRLLSTKKSSSSKKFRYKTERPDINIKKGGLFNESTNTSNESNSLFRSHSSPNLFENREKRSVNTGGRRKLSIMEEGSPSHLEVSGIAVLDKDSFNTPPTKSDILKQGNTTCIPAITVTPAGDKRFNEMLREFKIDDTFKEFNLDDTSINTQTKTETPKNNAQMLKKTSSLEKIINRFKKVRENVFSAKSVDEFRSIAEEKENMNSFTVNRVLLPDLLSPSCSVVSKKLVESDDLGEKNQRKPRESLGTALGVDQTFLDQFDLID